MSLEQWLVVAFILTILIVVVRYWIKYPPIIYNDDGGYKHIYRYPMPAITADVIVWRNLGDGYEILVVKRKNDPFKGMWALPGGYLNCDKETILECAQRELREETGLGGSFLSRQEKETYLLTSPAFFDYYDAIDRDPRGRTITFVFILEYNGEPFKAMDDAEAIKWLPISSIITEGLYPPKCREKEGKIITEETVPGTAVRKFECDNLAFDHQKIILEFLINYNPYS